MTLKKLQKIEKPKNIGVFYNPGKTGFEKILTELEKWAKKQKVNLIFASDWHDDKKITELADSVHKANTGKSSNSKGKKVNGICDIVSENDLNFVICLGGDGTILRLGRCLAGKNVAILGVNLGRLGFLAEINKHDLISTLDEIVSGKNYSIESRDVLDIKILRNNKVFKKYICVNEIAVKNGEKSRIVDIDFFVDDKFVVRYIGDGLIVSTPTGSTAYSLAAGGPIVCPELSVFLITAICPHTLNLRPLVVESDKKLAVKVLEEKDTTISIDGQISEKLFLDDTIVITKSDKSMKLLASKNYNYFDVLRKKLSWGNR